MPAPDDVDQTGSGDGGNAADDLSPGFETELLALAPGHLSSYWNGRYTADDERRSLSDFAEPDQASLSQVYQLLLELFLALRPHYLETARASRTIGYYVTSGKGDSAISAMQRFGAATLQSGQAAGMARAIHDLRGGAFQTLSFRLEIFDLMPEKRDVQTIFFLTRDHLKIMRNAVCDLDVERFNEDHSKKNHNAQLLVEKWSQTEFLLAEKLAQVRLHCHYTGSLCESCLEFSTLDRIIYNLMNNAARYAADGAIHFFMLPMPPEAPETVRFVFCNAVEPAHRQVLLETFGDDLSEIFRGGFTTDGHGLGMRICADFCSQAFGLSNFETAKEGAYFGSRWIEDQFAVWFHWPIAHDAQPGG
jgi:hypothetical protein